MGIVKPTSLGAEHESSKAVCSPLIDLIINQERHLGNAAVKQKEAKRKIQHKKSERLAEEAKAIHERMPQDYQRPIELACEKGASTWLTSLPLSAYGFSMHKTAFRDAICLRYNWRPNHLSTTCACGEQFTTSHALSCPTGAFPTIRHNELRDICSDLLSEVCSNVSKEPLLQPLTGGNFGSRSTTTDSAARLDIAADGFWGGRFERTFFDIKVFNPFVRSGVHT